MSRNWKVDLQSNKFNNRNEAKINRSDSVKTVWTINGKEGELDRNWQGHAADNGNSIHGSFTATFQKDTTNGRLKGAFGAERH